MRPSLECAACVFTWVYERTASHVEEAMRPRLSEAITLAVYSRPETENIGLLCNKAVYSAGDIESSRYAFYAAFKQRSNERAATLLPFAQKYIEGGETEKERIERACVLAAASNVAPLLAPAATFTFQEAIDIMEGRLSAVVMGDLYETVRNGRRVLYITDNAGEVGFDSLVLKALKGAGVQVTLVVKEDPFFEDVRMDDVDYFHLEELVDEVLTAKGFFVSGEVDARLQSAYLGCDVLFVKGTGGFEALRGETTGKKAVFMLKVKCGPISRDIGVEQGRVVVMVEG